MYVTVPTSTPKSEKHRKGCLFHAAAGTMRPGSLSRRPSLFPLKSMHFEVQDMLSHHQEMAAEHLRQTAYPEPAAAAV